LTQNHFLTRRVFSSLRLSLPDNFELSREVVISERNSCEQGGVALRSPPQSKKVRQEDVPNASARSSF
jgi:hypothetical protein